MPARSNRSTRRGDPTTLGLATMIVRAVLRDVGMHPRTITRLLQRPLTERPTAALFEVLHETDTWFCRHYRGRDGTTKERRLKP